MARVLREIGYFSQWESKELVDKILKRDISAREDKKWRKSGALTSEEYELWSWNICGMACLKMILKSKTGKEFKTVELAKKCEEYGGYAQTSRGVEGLLYDPFAQFIEREFGFKSRVFRWFLTINRIKREVMKGGYFMVSVSASIRDVSRTPVRKGGHLVLITGFDNDKKTLFLHNPSGLFNKSQENFEVSEKDFIRFFARRGVLIY